MAFIQYIIEDNVLCPRCNADSQIRVEDKEGFCIIIHVCKMCRYRRVKGITTRRALELKKREQKLLAKLNSSGKIEKNYKILARIKKLQMEISKEELGIGVK